MSDLSPVASSQKTLQWNVGLVVFRCLSEISSMFQFSLARCPRKIIFLVRTRLRLGTNASEMLTVPSPANCQQIADLVSHVPDIRRINVQFLTDSDH